MQILLKMLRRAAPIVALYILSGLLEKEGRNSGDTWSAGRREAPPQGSRRQEGGSGESRGHGSDGVGGGSSSAAGARARRERDPYIVLGCPRTASNEEIRKRYRDLASRYHPDKFIGQQLDSDFVDLATRKFQEIQEAYGKIRSERGI